MTCREKLKMEHPEYINEIWAGGCFRCPSDYEYLPKPEYCPDPGSGWDACERCWDREIPEKTCIDEYVEEKSEKIDKNMIYAHMGFSEEQAEAIEEMIEGKKTPNDIRDTLGLPHILDSGARREFESGAVRDIQEGKGRCDLLPLDICADYIEEFEDNERAARVFRNIRRFQESSTVEYLYFALNYANPFEDNYTMILEVAKQFEEGAKKYGERNWEKGIPVHCYIDSAIRHYMKYLRGDKDEPHNRALCWNLMCAIWTCVYHPELNDYAKRDVSAVEEITT